MYEKVCVFIKDNYEMLITAGVAFGSMIIFVLKFVFEIYTSQQMNEIERAFLSRKEKTLVFVWDFLVIFFTVGAVMVGLIIYPDNELTNILLICTSISLIINIIYFALLIILSIFNFIRKSIFKSTKTINIKWAKQLLFSCVFFSGIGIGKIVYYNTQSLKIKLLLILIIITLTILFMMLSVDYFKPRPSKIFFYNEKRKRLYIYLKLDEYLLCGTHQNIEDADKYLISVKKFSDENHEIFIDKVQS